MFFSLDRLTRGVIFRIVYDGGMTDLYIDNMQAVRRGNLSMPYFACVGIDNIGGCASVVPNLFQKEFENAGGIVLHPDEFFAALNPDYMIDLATPYLGAGDSSLIKAKTQLEKGKYFSSLMTVRSALKESKVDIQVLQPVNCELSQNYPNPFNQSTTIRFTLQKPENVRISIYSISGIIIDVILDEGLSTGYHEIRYEPKDIEGGIYFYKIEAGSFQRVRKMLYL
jgi:hypothetical protein